MSGRKRSDIFYTHYCQPVFILSRYNNKGSIMMVFVGIVAVMIVGSKLLDIYLN